MSVHAAHSSDVEHHEIAYPNDPLYSRITAGKLGMWIFLLSDGFSFGGLLLSYGILRGGSDYWGCLNQELVTKFGCAIEPNLGINFTAVLTFILICSSVSMVMAHAAAVDGDRAGTIRWLMATIAGGLMFLCGQVQEYWGIWHPGLLYEGLNFGKSHYATTFFCITGFHGLHVTTGVLYLTGVLVGTILNKTDANTIEICGLFWHFVDLVWILVFTFIYLIPHG